MVAKGKGYGVRDGRVRTAIFKVDKTRTYLLYNTGNSAQCHMAAWMGGGRGRTDACLCMAESLSCPPETITTLFIGYTPIENKNIE